MSRKLTWFVAAALLLAAAVTMGVRRWEAGQPDRARRALFAELTPVALANCEFERLGDTYDGGYLACGNLFGRAVSGYSYGINGNDEWGCDVSAKLKAPVHQYDCFNLDSPDCPTATTVFHEECIGPARQTDGARVYDTLMAQVARNGDQGKRLIVKMDVEGAEWPSFLAMPESMLSQIDQLTVEFHDVHEPHFVEALRKLKRVFHVTHVHYNNWTCDPSAAPHPALAFEVLFVNKSLAVLAAPGTRVPGPHPLDAPNNPNLPDCQVAR